MVTMTTNASVLLVITAVDNFFEGLELDPIWNLFIVQYQYFQLATGILDVFLGE
jgi:hypothetical protein